MKRSSETYGFTLIELMVVVAILGILMAVAVAGYSVFREKAKRVQVLADLKKIQLAIEDLAIDTDMWPGPNPVGETADKEVWDLNKKQAGLVKANRKFSNWDGPYLDSVPKDPWGSHYFFDPDYHLKDGRILAVIGSFGPNKKEKNKYDDDDITLILPSQ